MANTKVYEIITDRIMDMLERGVIPWHKTWTGSGVAGASTVSFNQSNYSTRGIRLYRGINQFLLCGRFNSPYWMTFKQAQELGGSVKKGEKSSMVIYWVWNFYDNETRAKITEDRARELINQYGRDRVHQAGYPFYYNVFNIEQTEGITAPDQVKAPEMTETEKIQACEDLLAGMSEKPIIKPDSSAYYSPSRDFIGCPLINAFEGPAAYYSTLFHEVGHWTGAAGRLNRPGVTNSDGFGKEKYSKEELIAEMTAAFLCDRSGISQNVIENQAAYIGGWLQKLKNDKKLVVEAAQAAQKAAAYIINEKSPRPAETSETETPAEA